MFVIKDIIAGEILTFKHKIDCEMEVERRLNYHNSEFTFGHRGHHYSENAVSNYSDKTFIIERKK